MSAAEWETDTVCRRNAGLLSAALGEELLMMSVDDGLYYNLNGVGARIWELLAEPTTPAQLVHRLVAEYAVETDVAGQEVKTFLAALRSRGLLTETPAAS